MKTFKKIILDDLKKQKLHNIAAKITSIRYRSFAGGDSVDVDAVNLFKTERETLEKILREYQDGQFDGMNDIYNYDSDKSEKERTAKYVLLHNTFSEDVRKSAIDDLKKRFGVVDDATSRKMFNVWFDAAVWRQLQQLTGDEFKKG
jgi:hypothetical protein